MVRAQQVTDTYSYCRMYTLGIFSDVSFLVYTLIENNDKSLAIKCNVVNLLTLFFDLYKNQ